MNDFAPVDLDLRLVGYFVAVAEHRHFGRAAAELRVAQPSLSRQIRRLEQQMGVRLFDRTPQRTRPTEAGEVFLPRPKRCCVQRPAPRHRPAPPPSPAASPSATRPVDRHPRGARIASSAPGCRRAHRAPGVERGPPSLLDHRVDAVVTRLPFPTDQLHVTILYDEPRVLVVPLDHRLAGKESITLDDIADEPMPGSATRTRPGTRSGGSIRVPTGVAHPTGRSSTRSRTSSK